MLDNGFEDVERLVEFEREAAAHLAERLNEYRERIRILTPFELSPGTATVLAAFTLYTSTGIAS